MSGHSKWHNIRERKGVQDRIRGKIFTIHAKLIALAARAGGLPEKNPALAEAIRKAKKDNVPEDNITRAIRKGSGQDRDAAEILEVVYEGYAPGGVGIIVRALTDNKNRTVPNMRHTFGSYGGSMAETGAVSSFAFRHVGVCTVPLDGRTIDSLEEAIIESGASDYSVEDDTIRIITERADLARVVGYLRGLGWTIGEWWLEYVPTTMIEVTDLDKAVRVLRTLEALEDDDDVECVWSNAQISDALVAEAHALMDSQKFRT